MESITINISVRDLVSFTIPGEDGRGLSLHKAQEGIEGHQLMHAILKEQVKPLGTYQREISVSTSYTHENYTLNISGRLDGLININNSFNLCEIKTTEKDLNLIDEDKNPAYWAQGRCYAYMIAREKEIEKIKLLLIYFHRITKEYRVFEQILSFTELERFFQSLVFPYINFLKKQHQWRIVRNNSIQALSFPFNEFRYGQREMSAAVYRSIRDGQKLFIQAPTGIGKTIGALFPAIKALGDGFADKIFYLTARNTTQNIALSTYETMARNGLRLKVLHITAKEKVCLSPDTPCTPEDCAYAAEYSKRSKRVISQLFKETDFFSRSFIDTAAKKYELCPFELSLELSLQSDLIVCDYNYAFDPRVYLKRFFLDRAEEKICLLLDEAHNLPDRAREMYSAEIKQSQLRNIHLQIKDVLPNLTISLKKVRKAVLEYIKLLPRPNHCSPPWFWASCEPPEKLIKPIENFLNNAENLLNDDIPYPFKDDLITLYFELSHFTKIYDLFGENYNTFIYRDKGDITVRLFCIDPAPMLKKRMDDAKSSILFSATLSPPQYFMDVLGGCKTDNYLTFPSPFPRENLYIYVDDTVSTRYKNRESTIPYLVECIHKCTMSKTGNYIVFFPSFSYMRRFLRDYRRQFPNDRIIVQETNMTEEQRQEFLNHFSYYGETTLIAFAVMGGIFGEGIDLKGELLSGVIIVGVGLPQVCAERDIIRQYYHRKTGNGFDFAYTYPGLNRVLQAAGRVIRSENDRGFIILIDDRFTTTPYKRILPSEWFPLQTPKDQKDLSAGLSNFWGRG